MFAGRNESFWQKFVPRTSSIVPCDFRFVFIDSRTGKTTRPTTCMPLSREKRKALAYEPSPIVGGAGPNVSLKFLDSDKISTSSYGRSEDLYDLEVDGELCEVPHTCAWNAVLAESRFYHPPPPRVPAHNIVVHTHRLRRRIYADHSSKSTSRTATNPNPPSIYQCLFGADYPRTFPPMQVSIL